MILAPPVYLSEPSLRLCELVEQPPPRPAMLLMNRIDFSNIDETANVLLEIKSLLPTSLTSAELGDLPQEILDRAKFMAQVTRGEYVQKAYDILDDIMLGKTDLATGRLQLQDFARSIGYSPAMTPDEEGTVADPTSAPRINLMLRTNMATARGYGQFVQSQRTLDAAPAQELYRAFNRKVPRNWIMRWQAAGGEIFKGRLIALKNSAVWSKLGSRQLFADAIGNPYAPFAWNSGMRTRSVDRETAVELGLIERDTQVEAQDLGFNEDLQVSPEVRADALRSVLTEDGYSFDGDVLTL
jgi:hypothetical protein